MMRNISLNRRRIRRGALLQNHNLSRVILHHSSNHLYRCQNRFHLLHKNLCLLQLQLLYINLQLQLLSINLQLLNLGLLQCHLKRYLLLNLHRLYTTIMERLKNSQLCSSQFLIMGPSFLHRMKCHHRSNFTRNHNSFNLNLNLNLNTNTSLRYPTGQ